MPMNALTVLLKSSGGLPLLPSLSDREVTIVRVRERNKGCQFQFSPALGISAFIFQMTTLKSKNLNFLVYKCKEISIFCIPSTVNESFI
jgi:hypothetical protein